jgi:hypothetical protein
MNSINPKHVDDRQNVVAGSLPFAGLHLFALVSCLLLLMNTSNVCAQYADVAEQIGVDYDNVGYMSSGFSAVDFNQDGWDDLTIGTDNNGIYFFQNNGGEFVEVQPLPYISGMIRAVQWIDIDGDDDLDFFANRYQSFPVMYRNDGNGVFTDVSFQLPLQSYDTRTSTVAWGDYNRDGKLDAYFCNYYMLNSTTNWLLRNDGDFNFTDVTDEAGVSDSVKTTYQAIWIDYDLNGWIDLYVSNDRMDGNAMYRNLGDGTFEAVAHSTGLNIVLDGMGINFDDYDNDLDYDLYVANTENGSYLLNQENGIFTNVAQDLGVDCPNVVSWGVQWSDASNDGNMDLYVVNDTPIFNNNQNYFFYQSENGEFDADVYGDFVSDDFESYACGEFDFNNDGYMDLININQYPPDVQIWQQDTGTNNWIKIKLVGNNGNTAGVGANMMVFFGDQTRLRSTHIGESFLAQNPYYETFGIGTATEVDSVAVLWPSGNIQMYYDLEINATNVLVEEDMVVYNNATEFVICTNDTISLFPGNFAHYAWSNGSQDPAIAVYEPGVYEVTATTLFGQQSVIQFQVQAGLQELPGITLTHPLCSGDTTGAIEIDSVPEIAEAIWSDGFVGNYRTDLPAGVYDYFLQDQFGCSLNGQAVITAPEQMVVSLNADTVCPGGTSVIEVAISGGTGNLLLDWGNTDPLYASAGVHSLVITDEHGCLTSDSVEIAEYPGYQVTISAPVACYGETVQLVYEAAGSSSYLYFDFDEVDPLAVAPGNYLAVVNDEHFCFQIIPFVVLENPALEMDLSYESAQGTVSAIVSGGSPPYSYLWSDASTTSELMDAVPGVYSCEVTDALGCTVTGEIEVTVGVTEAEHAELKTYPLPFHDQLILESDRPVEWKMYDLGGRLIRSGKVSSRQVIDTTDWSAGCYVLMTDQQIFKLMRE